MRRRTLQASIWGAGVSGNMRMAELSATERVGGLLTGLTSGGDDVQRAWDAMAAPVSLRPLPAAAA